MKITPEILKKIGESAKTYVLGIIKKAKDASGKADASKFTAAENVVKKIPVMKIAKQVAMVEVADEVAESVFKMPVLSSVYKGLEHINEFQIKAQAATVWKIPFLGPLLREASKGASKVVGTVASVLGMENLADAANKQVKLIEKHGNDPKWYLNLGDHVPFNIPTGYPDQYPTNLNFVQHGGGQDRTRVVNIEATINYLSDVNKTSQRVNQLFTLMKGVRGLSQVQYDTKDVFNYMRCVYTLEAMYFTFVKWIRFAKLYNLMKSSWPEELMVNASCPQDIQENLAMYENLVFQMKQALSVLPIMGTMWDKIKYLCTAFIADSNDAYIATYYHYIIHSRCFITTTKDYNFSPLPGKTYQSWVSEFNTLVNGINRNATYSLIIGDLVGAFGQYSMKDYSTDMNSYNLNNCYDQLALSVIQNTYSGRLDYYAYSNTDKAALPILDSKFMLGYLGGGGPAQEDYNSIEGDQNINLITYIEQTSGIEPGEATFYITPRCGMFNGSFTIPSTNQQGTVSSIVDDNAQIVVNCDKYKLNEGEALELLQNSGYTADIYYKVVHETSPNEDDASYMIALLSKTNVLAVTDIFTILRNTRYHLDYALIVPGDDAPYYRMLVGAALWSQADWAPKFTIRVHTISKYGVPSEYVNTLWDTNVFGYVTKQSLDIGIGYTSYSIYAPNVKAGGKTIDNIRDIYNTK